MRVNKDTRGALLLKSEKTYELLENMIQSVSSPLRSKRIHIGMDEAEELGRGIKAGIGVKLKAAYDRQDQAELRQIANEIIPEISIRVKELKDAHRNQWLRMNKPFGWEVIDIRYGGLLNRLDTVTMRVNNYLNGQIEIIEELEQERLYYSPGIENSTSLGWSSYYYRMASPNVFFHVLPIY